MTRKKCNYDLLNIKLKKHEESIVLYLNTIANHKIWKFSRKMQFEDWSFNIKEIVSSFIKTIESRKRVEDLNKIRHCQKIEAIHGLSDAAKWAILTFK